jgi:hypothetical protein
MGQGSRLQPLGGEPNSRLDQGLVLVTVLDGETRVVLAAGFRSIESGAAGDRASEENGLERTIGDELGAKLLGGPARDHAVRHGRILYVT